jgi:hypothetical protein
MACTHTHTHTHTLAGSLVQRFRRTIRTLCGRIAARSIPRGPRRPLPSRPTLLCQAYLSRVQVGDAHLTGSDLTPELGSRASSARLHIAGPANSGQALSASSLACPTLWRMHCFTVWKHQVRVVCGPIAVTRPYWSSPPAAHPANELGGLMGK